MRPRILAVLSFLLAALLLPPLALGKIPALSLPDFSTQPDGEDLGWIGEPPSSSAAAPAEEVMLPADSPLDIPDFHILNTATGQVETVPVRDYVRGAVAAELPASFHTEAMKAQAVAAHTWALHCALTQRQNPDPALKGADFSADPDHLKGWARAADIKATYGNMADEYWDKITTAADSVMDYVLLYEGEPIQAVYHSCSIGVTESAEHVWQTAVPYLVPVQSEGDRLAPAAEAEVSFSSDELRDRLTAVFDGLVLGENPALWLSPVSYTDSGYILEIKVGNRTVTGKEVRSALDLRSASFTIAYDSSTDRFTIRTQGYGHGVGLSQYGADYMARQGRTSGRFSPTTTLGWSWPCWTKALPCTKKPSDPAGIRFPVCRVRRLFFSYSQDPEAPGLAVLLGEPGINLLEQPLKAGGVLVHCLLADLRPVIERDAVGGIPLKIRDRPLVEEGQQHGQTLVIIGEVEGILAPVHLPGPTGMGQLVDIVRRQLCKGIGAHLCRFGFAHIRSSSVTGKVTRMLVPSSGRETSVIWPEYLAVMCLTMESPSPVPPSRLLRPLSTR